MTLCTGVATSPNHPENYPNNLEKTQTIQVEEGLIIELEFTDFNIECVDDCVSDHLTITDGDGTTLLEKSCGGDGICSRGGPSTLGDIVIGGQLFGSSLPPAIRSRSNTINIVFTTSSSGTYPGWSVSWRAVAGINHQPN